MQTRWRLLSTTIIRYGTGFATARTGKERKRDADLRMTLVLQHAVETLGVEAARMLLCGFAVAARDF